MIHSPETLHKAAFEIAYWLRSVAGRTSVPSPKHLNFKKKCHSLFTVSRTWAQLSYTAAFYDVLVL
jgi:hypothetical protein